VRIAFVGKGGSGKTSLGALFARSLAESGAPVLAIDADINQHLPLLLGMPEREMAGLPRLGEHLAGIKDYLRGTNPRIHSAAVMLKTTPPGSGSRLVRLQPPDAYFSALEGQAAGVRLLMTGELGEEDLGVKCYHSKIGAVELLLNHLIDQKEEYVVVDMTAGADAFASGIFTQFDLLAVVAEPTRQSLGVYQQYKKHAASFGIRLRVIGNKVRDEEDRAFLREIVGDDLLTVFRDSALVRHLERGKISARTELEPENLSALATLRGVLDEIHPDWAARYRHAMDFHRKNAESWGNASVGEDVRSQIDPTFTHLPYVSRSL
jgi:CO dehydrogenase maturation factor